MYVLYIKNLGQSSRYSLVFQYFINVNCHVSCNTDKVLNQSYVSGQAYSRNTFILIKTRSKQMV